MCILALEALSLIIYIQTQFKYGPQPKNLKWEQLITFVQFSTKLNILWYPILKFKHVIIIQNYFNFFIIAFLGR